MKHLVKVLLILAFLVKSQGIFGQAFPVQLTPQSIPPQPIYISDYANTNVTTDRLRLQILLNDIAVSNLEVKLKVYLEGEGIMVQSSDFVVGAAPLFLDGGMPLQLGSLDLAPYFEFQNLRGINPNVYADALPEGIYRFCYEVYDAFTGNVLSQKTCSTIVLFQNEPPFLTLPNDNSIIEQQDIYNILFQWTPRHINVTNAQYEFTLVQIFDNNVDPQAAFLSSQPIFQTVVSETNLLYDMRFPPLLGGYRYAWRVRAFASNGADEIGLFTNQGFSEIWSFIYTQPCNQVTNLREDEIGRDKAKIAWNGDPQHLDYIISYREKNAESSWYELETPREYISLTALRPATTYEYKVAGNCELGSFEYSPIKEFTTAAEEDSDNTYVCNVPPGAIDLSNETLLPELFVNDLFFANDFPITVLELTSSSAPFSGKGYIGIPWLGVARVGVEFQGIQINSDFKLVQGIVETTYDGDWGGIVDTDDIIDDVFGDEGDIDEFDAGDIDISDIEVNEDGDVIITDEDGNEIEIETDLPVVITDGNGDQWSVDEDGTVTPLGEEADGGAPDDDNTDGIGSNGSVNEITSSDVSIIFKESGYYSTDTYRSVADLKSKYETIPIADGGDYKVLYKAISDMDGHDTDILTVEATFANGKTKDDVVFKTMEGTAVPVNWDTPTTATLTLTKHFDFAKSEILATVKQADTTQNDKIAGKANVWHMSKHEGLNVTLVSVNGASIPSDIEAQLNAIYHPVGASFSIQEKPMQIDQSVWDIDSGGTSGKLDIQDSGILSFYTDEEKAIYNHYASLNAIEDNRYYVFITNNIETSNSSIAGFMPLKQQYGFVFNTSDIAKVLGHELGHGVFGLQHYEGDEKEDLLMNIAYSNGTQLTQMDWQTIHEPGIQFYLFQGDGDGASTGVTRHPLTPSWLPFKYTGDGIVKYIRPIETVDYPNGTVYGYIEDDIPFIWDGNNYVNENGDNLSIEIISEETRTRFPWMHIELNWYDSLDCSNDKMYRSIWSFVKNKEGEDIEALKNIGLFGLESPRIWFLGDIQCPNSTSDEYLNNDFCQQANISSMNEDRIALNAFMTVFNPNSTTKEEVVSSIKDISVCILRELTYDDTKGLLNTLTTNLSANISYDYERSIMKLLYSFKLSEINLIFSELLDTNNGNDKPVYESLFSRMQNSINIFAYDNENNYKEIIGYLTSKIESNSVKWDVINAIIRNAGFGYNALKELDEGAISEILISMENDFIVQEKIPQMVDMLDDMLVYYTVRLDGFKEVFEITKLRFENREVFAKFTRTGDENPPELGLASNSSWMYPIRNDQNEVGYNGKTGEEYLAGKFDWSNYLMINSEIKELLQGSGADISEFLYILKTQFSIFLADTQVDNAQFWEGVTENVSCTELGQITYHIKAFENVNSLKNAPESKRLYVLKRLFECSKVNAEYVYVDGTPDQLFKLLASFDPTSNEVITTIDEISIEKVLQELSGDRLDKFFAWTSGQIQTSGIAAFELDNDYGIKPVDIGLTATDAENGVLPNKDDLFKLEADIFKLQNLDIDEVNGNIFSTDKGPFDYKKMVMVYVSGSFTFMGRRFNKGDILTMPLLQAYAMSENNDSIVFTKSAWLVVDVISLTVGVGSVMIAIKVGGTIRKIVASADVLGSTAGLLANALNEDALSQETRFKFQMFSIVASLPSFAMMSRKVDDAITNLDRAISQETISNTSKRVLKDQIAIIASKLEADDALFFSRLNLENADIIKAQYLELSPELRQAFRADFVEASAEVLTQLNKTDSTLFNVWSKFRNKYPNKPFCN